MTQKKNFQELNLKNAFLFSAVLNDEEICRTILELVLGMPIPQIEVHAEHSLLFSSDVKSVRFDVYARDKVKATYDLEMQGKNRGNLEKRSRFYQAEMDIMSLKPGDDYSELKPSYVIFICTFDPFGKGLYQYTFEETCKETTMLLGTETKKVFLNTKGRIQNGVSEALIHFLRYVEDSSDAYVESIHNNVIQNLHKRVAEVKKSRKLEARYMTLEEYLEDRLDEKREEVREEALKEGLEEGLKEGLKEGQELGERRMLTLINQMLLDGLSAEIPQLATDEPFLKSMIQKYNL